VQSDISNVQPRPVKEYGKFSSTRPVLHSQTAPEEAKVEEKGRSQSAWYSKYPTCQPSANTFSLNTLDTFLVSDHHHSIREFFNWKFHPTKNPRILCLFAQPFRFYPFVLIPFPVCCFAASETFNILQYPRYADVCYNYYDSSDMTRLSCILVVLFGHPM